MNALTHSLLFLFSAAPQPAPPPILVRVAVVDNSPSMQGERIAAVRSELNAIINKLPNP